MYESDSHRSLAQRGANAIVAAVLSAMSTFATSSVGAQSDPADAGTFEVHLQPPELDHALEVPYPPEALEAGAEGVTKLALVIDAEGAVQSCSVESSSGREDLDDAVCAALLRTRFIPARRGDAPIAARIGYAHRFVLPAPAETTTPTEAQTPTELPASTPTPVADAPATPDVAKAEGDYGATAVTRAPPATQLRRSAEAVQVVELKSASQQSADLGEVMARRQGVGIRRTGGLGSATRLSLNGLTDDQIRFFVDGVPLAWMGFPFGIANVPIHLIEHVEIYRGVLPVRFGSDALGGAVNLRTREPAFAPNATFSYQTGSFGTHRLTIDGGHLFTPSGVYVRARAFLDRADNDYPVLVEISDATGRRAPRSVRRLHDGYAAHGGTVEVGVTDASFADRLSLRLFLTDYSKEIQHNVVMEVPYGEAAWGELNGGALLRYENAWQRGSLAAVVGYGYTHTWFTDVAECTYNWYRQCTGRFGAGEIGREPRDQRRRAHAGMARVTGEYELTDALSLRATLSPTLSTRDGEERANGEGVLSAIDLRGDFLGMVAGTELELDAFDDRLQLIAFGKQYLQSYSTSVIQENMARPIQDRFRQPGAGAALRWTFSKGVYAKTSYEWATRLLRPEEIFGNGALIYPNLDLLPEVSHNANAGLTVEGKKLPWGVVRADLNLFLRLPDRLVVLLGRDDFFQFFNVNRARSMGAELAAGWTSPRELLSIDANATYQDFRNTSDQGTFGAYQGDRIPNRPFFFANLIARAQLEELIGPGDRLSVNYYLRYVEAFFRNWESVGASRGDIKQTIDTQILHSIALTYAVRREARELTNSLEFSNITDARAFDMFGVQRPGRAVYYKVTGEF